jgi:RimJ/RimL family protein N-acetyltransferase
MRKTQKSARVQLAFLRGKRLVLRPLLRSDVPYLIRWINDPEVWQYLKTTRPKSERIEEEWVDNQCKNDQHIVFMIETIEGVPIGTMGIHGIDWISGVATTGAMIGEKKYQNKGYGSEAKMLLLEYMFTVLNLRKVCSRAYAFNKRSVAYSKKCGYTVEGRLKKHTYRNGEYHDLVLLAITRSRYFKLKKK